MKFFLAETEGRGCFRESLFSVLIAALGGNDSESMDSRGARYSMLGTAGRESSSFVSSSWLIPDSPTSPAVSNALTWAPVWSWAGTCSLPASFFAPFFASVFASFFASSARDAFDTLPILWVESTSGLDMATNSPAAAAAVIPGASSRTLSSTSLVDISLAVVDFSSTSRDFFSHCATPDVFSSSPVPLFSIAKLPGGESCIGPTLLARPGFLRSSLLIFC